MGTTVAGDVLARLPQRGRSGGGRASFPPLVRGAWRIALARRRPPPSASLSPAEPGSLSVAAASMAVEEEGLRVFQSVRIKIGTVREREAAEQQRERGASLLPCSPGTVCQPREAEAELRGRFPSLALSPLPFSEVLDGEKGEPEVPAAFLGCAGRARSGASPGLRCF